MGKNLKVISQTAAVILAGFAVAILASSIIGAWAFIPLAIVYWTLIFCIVKPSKNDLKNIFTCPPVHLRYILLAFAPALFGIVSFAWGLRHVSGAILIAMWILFAVVNPVAEELFWRAYLLDNLSWKPIYRIIFSTVMFMISHLMWGVFSVTIRSYIMILPLLIMGLTWGYVYHKTQSLKWCVIAHFLVDIMNLSVWVFLNIYIPPVIQ